MTGNDDYESDPLYDVALMEVVRVIPPQLPEDAEIFLFDVRKLMVLSWLRGARWAREHPTTNEK